MEVEDGQRLKESHRRVLDHGDVLPLGTDECGHAVVGLLNRRGGLVLAFVAADVGLALEMRDHGIQDASGHQSGAGVIQMDAMRAAWCVLAPFRHLLICASHLTISSLCERPWPLPPLA